MDKKTTCRKYFVYSITGLVLAICLMSWRGILDAADVKNTLRIVSDAFTLPGVLFAGLAGLGWVAGKGGYDLFGYAWSNFTSYFVRDSYFKKPETYFDYVQRKNKERKPFNTVMFVVGLVLFFIGMVITAVYMLI